MGSALTWHLPCAETPKAHQWQFLRSFMTSPRTQCSARQRAELSPPADCPVASTAIETCCMQSSAMHALLRRL